MDLGFHLAMSYRDLRHPTSRKNFAAVVGQNHALILTVYTVSYVKCQGSMPNVGIVVLLKIDFI